MTKIILITMIKNESKILKRMIDTALPIVDAICIFDTGSTDNTVEVANNIIKESNLPGKVYSEKFIDFGISRSRSFTYAKEFLSELGWNPAQTYGLLLDADMKLVLSPNFDKNKMLGVYDSYKIKQIDSTSYYNIRLIRMSFDWVCKGKTHEYWTVENNVDRIEANVEDEGLIWIDDVSDGGCKQDKFERDEKLLLKGIEEEPEMRSRYYFYLAQTYFCLNRYDDAIEYYKKRISYGGWVEEVWYSYFMICKTYISMSEKDCKYEDEIEKWANKSHEFYKNRSDAFYITAIYFYEKKNLEKTQEYIDKGKDIPLPERDILFVEKSLYTFGYTSLQCQVYLDKKDKRCVEYGIKLMDKVNDRLKEIILANIIPYFDTVSNDNALELDIPKYCFNLALYWDKETHKYNYLMNDKLELLDKNFEKKDEETRQISSKHSCFLDKNTIVVPNEKKVFVNDELKETYEGICFLGNDCIKTLYPFSTNINDSSEKIQFLSYFKTFLAASLYNDKSHILLYSNMSLNNEKITVFYILVVEDGVIKQKYRPFTINNKISSIWAFTRVENDDFTIIFHQDNKFFMTKITGNLLSI